MVGGLLPSVRYCRSWRVRNHIDHLDHIDETGEVSMWSMWSCDTPTTFTHTRLYRAGVNVNVVGVVALMPRDKAKAITLTIFNVVNVVNVVASGRLHRPHCNSTHPTMGREHSRRPTPPPIPPNATQPRTHHAMHLIDTTLDGREERDSGPRRRRSAMKSKTVSTEYSVGRSAEYCHV